MKRAFVVTAAVCLLVTIGMSCNNGGGGGLTLEEYFQRLEELDQEADSGSSTAEAKASDSEDVQVISDAFSDFLPVIETFLSGIEDLEAPAEAEEAHDAAVQTGRAFQDEFERLVDDVQAATTLDELGALFDDEAFSAADQAFTDACLDLQQIATDNNITAALNCEDDGEAAPTDEA